MKIDFELLLCDRRTTIRVEGPHGPIPAETGLDLLLESHFFLMWLIQDERKQRIGFMSAMEIAGWLSQPLHRDQWTLGQPFEFGECDAIFSAGGGRYSIELQSAAAASQPSKMTFTFDDAQAREWEAVMATLQQTIVPLFGWSELPPLQ